MKFNDPAIRRAMGDYALSVGYPEHMSVRDFAQNHANLLFNYLLMRGLVHPTWYPDYRRAVVTEYKKWYLFHRRNS